MNVRMYANPPLTAINGFTFSKRFVSANLRCSSEDYNNKLYTTKGNLYYE